MYSKECIICGSKMFRKKKSEAMRKNWAFCSRKCKSSVLVSLSKARTMKEIIVGKCKMCNCILKGRNTRQRSKRFCSTSCVATWVWGVYIPTYRRDIYQKSSERMKGKRLSDNAYTPEAIEKKGKAIRGDKHWNWQGGKTSKEKRIRVSRKYMVWRKAVFERDNYTCVWCGDRSAKGNPVILHADHIKPFAFYPRLRFKVENGRVLCIDCHKKTDTYLRNKNPKTLTI